MKPIAPPPKTAHPGRFIRCQEAPEDALAQVAAAGIEAGWEPEEVATALVELADHRMLALIANRDVDRELAFLNTKRK